MSMSEKDFIALADALRGVEPPTEGEGVFPVDTLQRRLGEREGRRVQFRVVVDQLADFCAKQNPRFNRERWISDINGECGPNGGAV